MKKKILKYKQKYNYLEDKRLYWDMMKMEIGSFLIYKSAQALEVVFPWLVNFLGFFLATCSKVF